MLTILIASVARTLALMYSHLSLKSLAECELAKSTSHQFRVGYVPKCLKHDPIHDGRRLRVKDSDDWVESESSFDAANPHLVHRVQIGCRQSEPARSAENAAESKIDRSKYPPRLVDRPIPTENNFSILRSLASLNRAKVDSEHPLSEHRLSPGSATK